MKYNLEVLEKSSFLTSNFLTISIGCIKTITRFFIKNTSKSTKKGVYFMFSCELQNRINKTAKEKDKTKKR